MSLNLYSESELLADLGRRLRDQRLRRNILQKELAQKSGVSVSALKKLEAKGMGTLENFMKVVFALHLEKELQQLFIPPVISIAQMMSLNTPPRRRARQSSFKSNEKKT